MTEYLLQLHNLNITDRDGASLIKDLNIDILKNKVNVLIGESGSGKSLTVSALVQQYPTDLTVTFDSYLYQGQPVQNVRHLLGSKIGYISQNYASSFNDHTKLKKQLIAIYRTHRDASKGEALKQIERALGWVNLDSEEILGKYRFMLSGGQLERVYIASVLMLEPELIIADEPVAALDVINGNRIMELIQHIAKEHDTTLLLITHNLSHVLKYADNIHVINDGKTIEHGSLDYFNNASINPYTKKLFNARSQLIRKEDDDA
ncbi:ABC transporter ATP-binding protein [Staphylococcus condimenti]|uniref:ABC transporter ATP-binding protein n=1 Tax=Staphylococcus condimenti TaxID=70255 RepID=A0A143P8N1_9STAP|nr:MULTISPECIES: ATP-binding cassette domain-containing protein [Staphylococcus]AMY04826.1 peptide ABC transporter ATP-binding protein [Staphylococcus condimenti]MDK8644099.1 ATP-binding cassette domain-containing protein [Staphylococcus condimenti]OFP01416.1 peptide ABC transporter ATP-binding protein [Staphylococcus sp. HMSC065E08]PNZ57556.1 ABC transporter ATP-binding protein [Staphylococcus condimenti]QQS83373.1 ABC transporter ATP-binding protein [Staphylococcus condimenti]